MAERLRECSIPYIAVTSDPESPLGLAADATVRVAGESDRGPPIRTYTGTALSLLYNGDEIVRQVGLDEIQGDQKGMLTLQIRRDSKVFAVSYLPCGETIEVPQWTSVSGIADSACKY